MPHANSHRTAAQLTAIAVAVAIAFATGRYVLPFDPTPSLPLAHLDAKEGEGAAALIDSLIAEWISEGTSSVWDRAALNSAPAPRLGEFPDTVRGLASRVQETYNIPAPVVLAQWALESAFGSKHLGAHNYFGHKVRVAELYSLQQPPRSVTAFTREYVNGEWQTVRERFAAYRNQEECFDVHGRFLNRGYASALRHSDNPEAYARAIGKRYATDPGYASKLITIMKRYQLEG